MSKGFSKLYCILFLILCTIVSSSCQGNQDESILISNFERLKDENNLEANQVVNAFKNAALPIDKIEYFTNETDFENLLGKSGQYIEKVSWIDSRIKTNSNDNLIGGTIEVFETINLLQKRKNNWLVKEKTHGFENYYFENKNVLMILDGSLSQEQISDYEKVFNNL